MKIQSMRMHSRWGIMIIIAAGLLLSECSGVDQNKETETVSSSTTVSIQTTDTGDQWDDVTIVKIYSNGYYGREMDDPLVITDEETIRKLTDAITNSEEIKEVPPEERFEGINGLFVDFGNGIVISMYDDESYGNIGSEMIEHGDDVWLPEEFHEIVVDLLKRESSY